MLLWKLSSPISFYFFNVAIRIFWIMYVAHIIFLLDSVILEVYGLVMGNKEVKRFRTTYMAPLEQGQ